MLLIVGLGNPEPKYLGNRHNVGFQAVDAISEAHGFGAARKKFSAEMREGRLADARALLLKPQTFYNDSGRAVADAARFYKIDTADIIVFHDELDLAPGKVKVKVGGGAAGNNGLKSITAHLDDSFTRVRIGIGHPGHKDRVTPHVLSDFSKAERADWLDDLLRAMATHAPLLAGGDQGPARFLSALALEKEKKSATAPKPAPEKKSAPAAEPVQKENPESGGAFATLKNLFTSKD